MAFPIVFIWFLIAIFIFRHHLRKNSKAQEAVTEAFLKKERDSLVVRRKDLLPEDYIHPNLSEGTMPVKDYFDGPARRYREQLLACLAEPMVNFQHTSNTELRLAYGTAMITQIETYENNYNNYLSNLFKLGNTALDNGDTEFALTLLEEGIDLGTDNRNHFLLLAGIYKDLREKEKLQQLLEQAKTLQSLTKDALLKDLIHLLES